MKKTTISKRLLTGMLALITALSFSFADFTVVFAEVSGDASTDPASVVASADAEASGDANSPGADAEQSSGDVAKTAEDAEKTSGDAKPDEDAEQEDIDIPTRDLVKSIPQTGGWYITPGELEAANIRALAKQGPTSYNVLQGSCTNGSNYFYFAFMKKATEKVKIIRMKLENGVLKYSKSSGAIDNYHGNGMAFIKNLGGKKNNNRILITNARSGETNHITVLNPNKKVDGKSKMVVEYEIVCKYWNNLSQCEMIYADGTPVDKQQKTLKNLIKERGKRGFSGIAYDQKNNRLVCTTTTKHDLIIFDLKVDSDDKITLVPRKFIVETKPGSIIQDIDCDENYIYVIWNGGGNKVCTYDWRGNNIANLVADKTFEMEGMFHTGSGDDAQFFTTYHRSYLYDKVTYTTKKVKWKKVWNKKHTKKIWKYKTKKVEKVTTYIYRDAYLRNIGNLTVAK